MFHNNNNPTLAEMFEMQEQNEQSEDFTPINKKQEFAKSMEELRKFAAKKKAEPSDGITWNRSWNYDL